MHKLAASATVAALSLISSNAAFATGDWSGFHVDGHVDAGWMNSHWSGFDGAEGFEGAAAKVAQPAITFADTVHFKVHNDDTGWGGGLGLGYNFQSGNAVFGAIVDWTWLNASASRTFAGPVGPDRVSTTVNSVGTVRGILGWGGDTVMPYITAGWAWGDVKHRFASTDGLATRLNDDGGWTGGGGIDIAVGPRTALNLEILYVDFGSQSKAGSTSVAAAAVKVHTSMTIARVGVDFRF